MKNFQQDDEEMQEEEDRQKLLMDARVLFLFSFYLFIILVLFLSIELHKIHNSTLSLVFPKGTVDNF